MIEQYAQVMQPTARLFLNRNKYEIKNNNPDVCINDVRNKHYEIWSF